VVRWAGSGVEGFVKGGVGVVGWHLDCVYLVYI
jgi:hypothetical protein